VISLAGLEQQTCKRCGQRVINPGRKTRLCLDCLIEIIAEGGDDIGYLSNEVKRYV
jgi:hypothetical protein